MPEEGRRRVFRRVVAWPALVISGDSRVPSLIVDISEEGARLELSKELPTRSGIVLVTDRIGSLEAQIVWRRGKLTGIRFTDAKATEQIAPILRSLKLPRQFGRQRNLRGRP